MTSVVATRWNTAVSRTRLLLLLLLFFLSGLSGLAYQIAWQRLLGLFGGSDSISAAIVVGAFLLGLGLGSLIASSFADRLSDDGAVAAFALCELGIAAFATASKLIFYDFLFRQMAIIADSRALVFLVVFLALLIPTLLMGLSLPLLAKGIVRNIETASERIGWLYGVNTLGAAAGAFLAGCFMIGVVGYEVTLKLAAVVSLSVGAGALLLALGFGKVERTPDFGTSVTTPIAVAPANVWQWCILAFVSGFIIISLEILWFRVIGTMLQSSAYSFALVLGWFLVGDALGIFIGVAAVKYIANPRHFFFWLQGAVTLYAITALWLISAAHYDLFSNVKYDPALERPILIAIKLTLMAFLVVPPAVLLGMSFPITQMAIQNDAATVGRRVGLIQFANIFGNTAGSVVTGLILLHYVGTAGSLRLLALLGLIFIGTLVVECANTGTRWRRQLGHLIFAAGLFVVIVGFPNDVGFWSRLHGVRGAHAILGEDRTGITLMVSRSPETGELYVGGHRQSGVPFFNIHGILGILGVLVHPSPRSVMVVGFGTGGTAYGAGANSSIERIQVVEIVGPIFSVMGTFSLLGGKTAVDSVLGDPRYVRKVGDARHALFTDPHQYDVIQADALNPRTSLSGLLYSVEYFSQVRARLNPGGICVQWAPTARTVHSFMSVFPYGVLLVDLGILLGGDQPIHFDPVAVARHLLEPKVKAYLEAARWDVKEIGHLLVNSRVRVWGPSDPRSDDVNTDLFPKDEFHLSGNNWRTTPISNSQ